MSTTTALIWKTRCHFLNGGRIVRSQSSFKWIFVLCFAVAFEAGLLALFLDGFRFLDGCGGIGGMIINRLFSLFFFGLGFMLIVSSVVTSYQTIFRSDEIPFLMAKPFSISQIVIYKFMESTALSSWAFFFIVIPFVGAYAWHEKITALFALWAFLFSIPFLVICSGIGTIIVMALVRRLPRGRSLGLIGMGLAACVCVSFGILFRDVYDPSREAQFNISGLIPGMNLAANALFPSWWVSEGIVALAHGEWLRGGMLWGVTLSTAMMIVMIVEWVGGWAFYPGWQKVVESRETGHRAPVMLARFERFLQPLPCDIKAMVMKDIRTFFRDPAQWSQTLIFFGLLFLYFVNLRQFRYHVLSGDWRNIMAFLNVFSVSAVMCSLGSRFIYPQLSLEGQGFWVLGLSPTTPTRILLTKFVMALIGMLAVSLVLVLLSSGMLAVPWHARLAGIFLVMAVSLAVCGCSTGFGAIFLDLKQRNSAAIVSGFGGTLNLVCTLAFMLMAIFPFAFAFHLNSMFRFGHLQWRRALLWLTIWLVSITAVTTVVPLWLGIRSLRNRDL